MQLLCYPEKEGLLQRVVRCLELARRIYFTRLAEYILPLLDASEQERTFLKLHRTFHHMVAYSSALPWDHVSALLNREFTKEALTILGINSLKEEAVHDDFSVDEDMEVDREFSVSYRRWREEPSVDARTEMMTENDDAEVIAARDRLLSLLNGLQLVGLGGDKAQKVFASVMNSMMIEFVLAAYPVNGKDRVWYHSICDTGLRTSLLGLSFKCSLLSTSPNPGRSCQTISM